LSFDYVEWVEETKKLVRKYSPSDPTIDNMLDLILMHANRGRSDEAERLKLVVVRMLGPIYQAKAAEAVSMPIPEKSEGDITLGTVFQSEKMFHEFRIPLKDLNRHVGIFASSGHGKTVLIMNLIRQIMEYNRNHPDTPLNLLVFDFKQDFRHLKDLPIICLRWNWLRLNPFVPPEGVKEPDWFNLVCNIMAHTFSWFFGSQYYLFEFVNAQYEQVRENSYVHMDKVRESIENIAEKDYKRGEYRNVVLNRLTTLTQVLHDVLDCEQGVAISDLLNYPVIIELDGLDEGIANFLVNLFLVYIMGYRMAQQQRGELKHLMIFDEAHRVFYKAGELRQVDIELGPSPTQQLPRVIRDFDEGLVFSSQEPSKINDSVIANTDLKLVGYLGSGFDINAVQSIYRLEYEDSELIKKLKLGQWMVQKSGIPDPFLLQGVDYPLAKTVTDAELKDRMKEFIAKMQSEPRRTGGTMLEYVKLPPLTENAMKILAHVGEKPMRNISHRYRELGMHPLAGKSAVKELHEKKFVVVHPIQLSAGRPSGYLEPTELGRMWMQKNNVSLAAWDDYVGSVGIEHRVIQWQICNAYKKLGYKASHEYIMDGKRFDCFIEKYVQESPIKSDGSADWKVVENIGIEVCISPKTDFLAAEKLLDRLSQVVYVCKDLNTMNVMQKEFVSLGISSPKMRFAIAHRFLADLYSQISKTSEEAKEEE
jgi:hypothetical protein